ncbi:MAG: transglycosylase SLT domain-containing protein [Gammaproteobacteria bacterium]|nr:transglycosylase SLT domain-containing protein [Gammaproteobacteria bacterium]
MSLLPRTTTALFFGLGLLLNASQAVTAAAAPVTENAAFSDKALIQQRALFTSARDALARNQMPAYRKLLSQLQDYPLYPYLLAAELQKRLPQASNTEIRDFIDKYQDSYVGARLRYDWLQTLAQREQWKTYLSFYDPQSEAADLECYARRAQYKLGNREEAFKDLDALWLANRSLPRECDPLFAAWRETGALTDELLWDRVRLAMSKNQAYLAHYLERFLKPEDREWIALWREMHRAPDATLDAPKLKTNSPIARAILIHGIKRLAKQNPTKAGETWDRLVMDHAFTPDEVNDAEASIAVALARNNAPEAMRWLANLKSGNDNSDVRLWRVLTAVNQDAWNDVIFWIDQMTPKEQQSSRWRYWRARAYDEIADKERAQRVYREVAKTRDFYGFMAADRITVPYQFEDKPLNYSPAELAAFENTPPVLIARELYFIGDINNARREWNYITRNMDEAQLMKAAKLAHSWGWHDRAILTLNKTEFRDDLELRFPLEHRENVAEFSSNQSIDPSWAYAIIRQESAFTVDARSPVGAMGLMQIMPRTGKNIARDLDTRLNNSNQLLEARTNIRFGVSYLRKVLNRFGQNMVLATAAYNAGPQRVASWLPKEQNLPPDRWVENIPFAETQNYVRQVMAFTVIYDQRMDRSNRPQLTQRMPLIVPDNSKTRKELY